MTILTPTVHMNGTSRGELAAQLEAAMNAIDAAKEAVRKACPNGRDFYPQGPDAIQTALAQHSNRLHNLEAVACELYVMAEAIAERLPTPAGK